MRRIPVVAILCCLGGLLQAQTSPKPLAPAPFSVQPTTPKQGDVLRISATTPTAADYARLGTRTIRLFPQIDGSRLALMPIGATHRPGPGTIEFLDRDRKPLHTIAITIRDARFPTQNVQLGKAQEELKPVPGESELLNAFRVTVSETRYWAEPFQRPVAGCQVSPFGVGRLHNGKPTGNFHAGLDQRGAKGTPIHAIAAGTAKLARPFQVPGNFVGLDHGQGLISGYSHMSALAVKEGAQVARGDVIGFVGSTGRSTAPHLHWSVSANGVSVNPSQWVKLEPCAARPPAPKKSVRSKPRP